MFYSRYEICLYFGSGRHFRAKNSHHQSPRRMLAVRLVGDVNARDLSANLKHLCTVHLLCDLSDKYQCIKLGGGKVCSISDQT